ncbi:MAG: glycosyl hydrolase [Acidimicrobiia bacterium]|nr:glycosyl hydrolase [Acidimicrobiia bacterium]
MRLGLHLESVPQEGLASLDAAEALLGLPVEILHWFQAWGGGHGPFRADWLDAVAATGRTGLLTWEPWALTGEATQPAYAPEAIAAGSHDAYLASWAAGFAARTDGPWAIRLMHEANGTWYPWSGRQPGAGPDAYKAAWVHIHDVFRAAGAATAVRWVWCPLVDDVAGPFEAWYPGDAYVDLLALDAYNWGAAVPENGGWRTPGQLLDGAYDRLAALGPQPIWLAELGCAPEAPLAVLGAATGAHATVHPKAAWLAELLSSAPHRWPRLEAVVFFSLAKERDWRVHHDPAVATAIRSALGR